MTLTVIGKTWYYTKYLTWVLVYFVEMIKYYNSRTHAIYEMALDDNSKWCATPCRAPLLSP